MVDLLLLRQNHQRRTSAHTSFQTPVRQWLHHLMKPMHAATVAQITNNAHTRCLFLLRSLRECRRCQQKKHTNSRHDAHKSSLGRLGATIHQAIASRLAPRVSLMFQRRLNYRWCGGAPGSPLVYEPGSCSLARQHRISPLPEFHSSRNPAYSRATVSWGKRLPGLAASCSCPGCWARVSKVDDSL